MAHTGSDPRCGYYIVVHLLATTSAIDCLKLKAHVAKSGTERYPKKVKGIKEVHEC